MSELKRYTAHKEKDRTPYQVTLGPKHLTVLQYLADAGRDGATDRQTTFGTELHMAAARRCELRDLGAVRRGGRRNGSWTWKLTEKGHELLAELKAPVGA